jgi:CHAD domain-containing protein
MAKRVPQPDPGSPAPSAVAGLRAHTSLEVAGCCLVAARLGDVQRCASDVQQQLGEAPIHELRIALRRLRAALNLFGRRRLRKQGARLKPLQAALGMLRDDQVRLEWLSRHGASGLFAKARRDLVEHQVALTVALVRFSAGDSLHIARCLSELHRTGSLGGKRMRRSLARLLPTKKMIRRAGELGPAGVHGLRIALKKLSYTAELLATALPTQVNEVLARFGDLQDRLGDLHDADVQVAQLEREVKAGTVQDTERARVTRAAEEERKRLEPAVTRSIQAFRRKSLADRG